MFSKLFLFGGGVAGALGVALGALTAHALAARLDAHALANLDTVSRYLLVHGVALVAVAAWSRGDAATVGFKLAGVLLLGGMILFSGGLTASALDGPRLLTAVAPAGGMALIAGWLTLALTALLRA